ncbi:hypothetical protein PoB_006386700 [Plakobranchus ocellatus]|uniref:Uncharacterized protein n=1 Tax=Plakobranchus ocellatus TaxID=259542 RepID=A0AAV4CZP9_9GAST|nr:hypothetical protein PoB_006386700 [Plakobranchus ocellatus]
MFGLGLTTWSITALITHRPWDESFSPACPAHLRATQKLPNPKVDWPVLCANLAAVVKSVRFKDKFADNCTTTSPAVGNNKE